jgi:hypothetical protein
VERSRHQYGLFYILIASYTWMEALKRDKNGRLSDSNHARKQNNHLAVLTPKESNRKTKNEKRMRVSDLWAPGPSRFDPKTFPTPVGEFSMIKKTTILSKYV